MQTDNTVETISYSLFVFIFLLPPHLKLRDKPENKIEKEALFLLVFLLHSSREKTFFFRREYQHNAGEDEENFFISDLCLYLLWVRWQTRFISSGTLANYFRNDDVMILMITLWAPNNSFSFFPLVLISRRTIMKFYRTCGIKNFILCQS